MQNNSVSALSSKLTAQLEADKAAIAAQTEKLLKMHEESLIALSKSVLATTKNAMGDHLEEINEVLRHRAQQIRKALALPFVVFLSLCLLIGLGTMGWSWWQVRGAQQKVAAAEVEAAGIQKLMEDLTTKFCSTPAGKANCTGSKK